mgnify:CR=1 FL=1
MFFQDDGFTTAPKDVIDSVFDIYDKNDLKMLHLDNQDTQYVETCDQERVHRGDGVNIYYSNTDRWVAKGLPHFGDSPYIANVDVLLNELYLEGYFQNFLGFYYQRKLQYHNYLKVKIHLPPMEET